MPCSRICRTAKHPACCYLTLPLLLESLSSISLLHIPHKDLFRQPTAHASGDTGATHWLVVIKEEVRQGRPDHHFRMTLCAWLHECCWLELVGP
ncbi:uncharacterized protein B0I36DRAFT_64464 [Microdochium trichocladiopsis]|uniref:Uncharacterized protein n=1 Tax=Microdochium trichocladiopsis TaxID=1682393 RepID=A0A9P8YDN3_9PEZI|nr:uncharacterized protein B0I36DRAFT_64464 [Microdochium trichocladiopsis]KAH7037324.1 hypothetical protein B0I36DRAFT_64464 [Microdochium trichocladiopsis]